MAAELRAGFDAKRKGEGKKMVASGNTCLFRVSGVKCDSYDHAAAADQILGVHDKLN